MSGMYVKINGDLQPVTSANAKVSGQLNPGTGTELIGS
jgi:hypothetical protein